MPRNWVCLTLLLLLMAANARGAENWPEFRGPTGQGHSSVADLPTRWSPTENVVWKAAIPGKGWSSPIVWNGRIYLTTAVPLGLGAGPASDQSLRALCIDGNSGEILWNMELFRQDADATEPIHQKNSHASPTPVTDGEHLYVHFGTQGTACLTLDGETVWSTRELKYEPRHGGGGSPVLVEDLLVVSCDGMDRQFIVALERTTGEIRWKTDRPEYGESSRFSFTTPLVIDVDGRQQIVSPASDLVIAYDPEDGSEIWRVRYKGYSVIPRPVYANRLVYVSTSFNNPVLLAIRPTGRGDVTDTHVEWKLTKGAPHTPSMLLSGQELYCVSDKGIATCLDARTGEVHWQERIGGNYSASPLLAGDRIYLQSESGETTIIAASREFKEIARNSLNGATLASPAVIGSDLLIRTDEHLYQIGEH